MHAVVDTFIYRSCNNIVEICVGEYGNTGTREEILQKKEGTETGHEFYTYAEYGTDSNLARWDEAKKPCPKCNDKMEQELLYNNLVGLNMYSIPLACHPPSVASHRLVSCYLAFG